jgi:hypothetical protein
VVVELLARRNPLPGTAAKHALPIVGRDNVVLRIVMDVLLLHIGQIRRGCRNAVVPDIPVRLRVGARRCALHEPSIFIGRVVEHHFEHNMQIVLLRLGQQMVEILERSVLRIDCFVVGDVIPEIDLRRWIDGREPDGVHAEMLQIVEVLRDAVQVANAVAI